MKNLLVIALLLITSLAKAQNFGLVNVQLNAGLISTNYTQVSSNQLISFFGWSDHFTNQADGIFNYSNNLGQTSDFYTLDLAFGKRGDAIKAYWQLGFSYGSWFTINARNYLYEPHSIDSYSPESDLPTLYVDSIYTEWLSATSHYNIFGVALSRMYRKQNDSKRWSLDYGFTTHLNFLKNTRANYTYTTGYRYEYSNNRSWTYWPENNISAYSETYNDKNGYDISVFFPISVGFKPFLKNDFLNDFTICYNLKVGGSMFFMPRMDAFGTLRVVNQVGLRIDLG